MQLYGNGLLVALRQEVSSNQDDVDGKHKQRRRGLKLIAHVFITRQALNTNWTED